MFNKLQMMIVAQMFKLLRLPAFWQTPVSGCCSCKIKSNKMKDNFLIEKFDSRIICLKGVGKMFYQEGFPISMAVSELKKQGIEVSILHVADECLKNGWSAKTTYNKLKADFEEDIDKENKYDLETLERFCWSDYEIQREMIFKYLFSSSTDDVRTGKNKEPLNWLRAVLQ
jgi:hypothetical protein